MAEALTVCSALTGNDSETPVAPTPMYVPIQAPEAAAVPVEAPQALQAPSTASSLTLPLLLAIVFAVSASFVSF
jgi:hypothetical protein